MTRDFANSKRKGGTSKQANARPRSPARKESAPWVWFISGLVCGIFLSGLSWLAFQETDGLAIVEQEEAGGSAVAGDHPRPRFDFYTLLPEQTLKLDLETASPAVHDSTQAKEQYLLQAGSFRQPGDADRRRGELLLLGLDAHVEEAEGDNGHWFRVYIGPFQSRSKLAKARSLTAQQGIDTLVLKRPRPNRG